MPPEWYCVGRAKCARWSRNQSNQQSNMKISELLANLQNLQADLGDVPVHVVSADFGHGGDTYAPLDDVFTLEDKSAITLGATAKMCGKHAVPHED